MIIRELSGWMRNGSPGEENGSSAGAAISDRSVLINFDSFQYSHCISWEQNGNFSDVLPSELPISVLKFINEVGLVFK